jgi:hypothetical protein
MKDLVELRPFSRKSEQEQLSETIQESLAALSAQMTKGRLLKAGLIAGALAGLTAASAGVSSLRRRLEGASDDS